jgi:hypothetical protein
MGFESRSKQNFCQSEDPFFEFSLLPTLVFHVGPLWQSPCLDPSLLSPLRPGVSHKSVSHKSVSQEFRLSRLALGNAGVCFTVETSRGMIHLVKRISCT